MQTILCTQCLSQNPHYTKFCLTCGSAITPPRAMPLRQAVRSEIEIEQRTVEVSPQTNAWAVPKMEKAVLPSPQQQEDSGWLRSLKRLWFF